MQKGNGSGGHFDVQPIMRLSDDKYLRGGGGGGDLGHPVRCPQNVERQLRKRLLFLRDKVYRHHQRAGHPKERDSGEKHDDKVIRDQLSAAAANGYSMATPLPYSSVQGTTDATDTMHGNVGVRAKQQLSVGADVTATGNLPSLSPPSPTLLPAVRDSVPSPATASVASLEDDPDAPSSWRSCAPAERVCTPFPDRQNQGRFETEPPWDDTQEGPPSPETSTSARALVSPESSSPGSFDGTQPETIEGVVATSGDWECAPGGEQRPFLRRAWSEGKTRAEEGGVWFSRAARMRIMATAPIAGVSSSTSFFLDEALDADDQATVWLRKQQLQQLRRSCLANTCHSEGRPPPILSNPALSDDSRIHLPRSNHDDRPENIAIFSPVALSQGDAKILRRSLAEMGPRELQPPAQQTVGAGAVDGGGAVGMEPAMAMGWAPSVWVSRYIDYSSKFGRLFLLTDGTISILFNDDTRMVIEPAGVAFDYMEPSAVPPSRKELELAAGRGRGRARSRSVGSDAGLQRFKMRYTVDFFPFFLKKKVQILRHCRDRIVQEVGELVTGKQVAVAVAEGEGDVELDGGNTEQPPLVFVDRWQRSSRTYCFRLSDRTVQVVYGDGTEILLSSNRRLVTFVGRDKQRETLTLHMAKQRNKLVKRMTYADDKFFQLRESARRESA